MTVGVRGTTFDVLVWPDRVTVLLVAGAVDLTVRPRRVFSLNTPGSAITIYRDGRVVGPRNWTGTVTDFANLAPPSPPAQRRAAAPPPQNTAAAPPSRATGQAGTGGSNSAIDRASGTSNAINTVGGSSGGFAGGGRPMTGGAVLRLARQRAAAAAEVEAAVAGSKRRSDPIIDYGFSAPLRTEMESGRSEMTFRDESGFVARLFSACCRGRAVSGRATADFARAVAMPQHLKKQRRSLELAAGFHTLQAPFTGGGTALLMYLSWTRMAVPIAFPKRLVAAMA